MKMILSLIKILFISFCCVHLTMAETPQYPKSMDQLVKGLKLKRPELKNMLDILVQTGKITKDQAEKAKKEVDKLDDKDIQAIKDQAIFKLDNGMHKIPDMRDDKSKNKKKEKKIDSNSSTENFEPTEAEENKENTESKNESHETDKILDYLNKR
jgi:hypothetical protein